MERHPLDPVSLTAGLIFTVIAAFALSGLVTLGVDDLRWIGPALLVLFGVVLVASSVTGRSGDADATADAAANASPNAPEREGSPSDAVG